MTEEEALQEKMRRLREACPQGASAGREIELRCAFRAERQRRRLSTLKYWTAIAACLLLSFGWLLIHRPAAPPPLPPSLSGFVALPYGQGDVPLEQMMIVRVSLASAAGPAQADVLVGQDGIARAVRWVE